MRGGGRRGLAGVCAALAFVAVPAPAAASEGEPIVLSPLAISPHRPVDPVPAADGLGHLAYELDFANRSPDDVRIDRIEPLAKGEPIGTALEGEALAARLRLDRAGGDPNTLEAGGGATAFMDVTYPSRRRRPAEIRHRFTLTISPGEAAERTIAFTGVGERVRRSNPVEISPPLRGGRWLAASGCCTLNPHRTATLPINGTTYIAERFAIDFVQLDDEYRLFDGPVDQLSSYSFYGEPVRAAAAGRVVRVRDGLPDQVPGELPSDATVQTAGGNYVVTTIGGKAERFTFYAHLQPESIRVQPGRPVRRGQVIGLLGNSGNTDAPHLHFHVMSSPSPLRSNGLPFTFTAFRGEGMVTDLGPMYAGEPTPVDSGALAGRHREVLPLDNQLVGFGG